MQQRKAVNFVLSCAQVDWLKQMAIPVEAAFERYKRNGGMLSEYRYRHFIETPKGPRYKGIKITEANKIVRSLGLTMNMLDAVSMITAEGGMQGQRQASNDLASLLESCKDFLWNGIARKTRKSQSQEALVVELVGGVLNRDKKLSREVHKVALGELFDYLLENRMFKEYKDCLWGLARKAREDLCRKDTPWFPGCSSVDKDGCPIIDVAKTNALTEEQFEDAAILVRCVNMQINAVRSLKFRDKLQYEDLSLATFARYLSPEQIVSCQDDIDELAKKRDEKSIKALQKKLWLRKAFGEIIHLIKPVWLTVYEKSNNPYRWRFLCAGARLFYDWARYHWYSLDREDVKNATNMYKQILDMALMCDSDGSTDFKIKAQFMYMAATSCRYMAEAASSGKWGKRCDAIGYVVDAICYAKKAMEFVPKKGSRAFEYRFKRNYARIQTFAVRWWLKHEMPDMTIYPCFKGKYKLRGADKHLWGIDVLKDSLAKIEETLRCPISPDDRSRNEGTLCLRGKRLLEWEFHLRIQIEAIIAWLPNDSDAVHDNPQGCMKLAHAAFALILLNYAHLCRGKTHLGSQSLEWARRQVEASYSDYDFCFASIKTLDKTIQEAPPSATCRFEIINSIFFSFLGDRGREETWLYKELKGREKDNSPARMAMVSLMQDLNEDILPSLKEEDRKFRLANRRESVCENEEWVKKQEKWKDLPAFRHLNELIWGPGSNPIECERLFSYYGLDWNYYGKGDCHA